MAFNVENGAGVPLSIDDLGITLEIGEITDLAERAEPGTVAVSAAVGQEIHQTPKGGFMAKGKHEKCGTTVCAMMSKDNAEKALENGATKAY